MPHYAVDRHPQRQKIIDALLSGESPKSIVRWITPSIHFTNIFRYKRLVVLPALKRATQTAKILDQQDLNLAPVSPQIQENNAVVATSQALAEEPLLRRLSAKFARMDGAIKETLEAKDFDVYARLEAVEARTLELLGKATMHPGFVASAPAANAGATNVVIILPNPDLCNRMSVTGSVSPVSRQGETIDISAEYSRG